MADTLPAGTKIDNQATINFIGEFTGKPFNNVQSNATTSTVKSPDLALTKTHTGTPARGGNVTYSIVARNVGDAPTQGTVTVTDTLPAGMQPTAATGAGWVCNLAGQNVTCTRADALPAGQPYPAISVTATISQTAPASLVNAAAVSGGSDANPANNTATDPLNVASSSNLSISKAPATSTAAVGEVITFTLSVANAGPTNATGATVSDILPAGLALVDAVPSQGICTPTITCMLGNIAAGAAPVTIVIRATVLQSAAGKTLTNIANVSGNEPDPDTSTTATARPSTSTSGPTCTRPRPCRRSR